MINFKKIDTSGENINLMIQTLCSTSLVYPIVEALDPRYANPNSYVTNISD